MISSTQQPKIQVIYRNIQDLKPDPGNPRIHSPKQVRQIANSIKAFGYNVPILLDGDDIVVAGHGRLLASQQLGLQEVPTISLEHLSAEQAKAYRIADNRLTDTSIWDENLLAEQLQELSTLNLDFNLEAIGFDMGEIDMRIESLADAGQAEDDPADMLPETADYAVTQPSDLWQLSKHHVYCGNSLDDASYNKLMQGKQAAIAFVDAPFNCKIDGHVGGKGAIKHREFAMACGEMSKNEFAVFLTTAFGLLVKHSTEGSIHYLCMDWRNCDSMLEAGKVYTELKNICVWAKDNAGMGSLYRSQHEFIFVFKNGKAPHCNNIQLGTYGRNRSNLWRYPGIQTMRRSSEEGDLLAMHPTVKNCRMVADALLDCSRRNDIVLDPFLGSGTTLIAAQRVGRICYGIELDVLYVDTIIRRWQNLTGENAIHATTGESFNHREKVAQEAYTATQPAKNLKAGKEVCHG